ncbi:hypothetical protein Pla123a_09420 [Posidoniimonas polymericola]|uniref:PEP-CTERM protein-sorting domain-containing protein n=2 Tax=Posidoniimonas polymericola TaxID=2528002 RepID=A0A5C5YT29_9BACT|nr:hypothetical protein Pla123a_09420 [Posidoniimonas polymericola]
MFAAAGGATAAQVAVYDPAAFPAYNPEFDGWLPFRITGAGDSRSVADPLIGATAWQLADTAVGGAAPQYYQPMTAPHLVEALQTGWRMTATARVVTPSLAAPSMGIGAYLDDDLYLLQLDLQGGDLWGYVWDRTQTLLVRSERLASGADALAYHDYELRGSPNGTAELLVDGASLFSWPGGASTHTAGVGLVQFGASTPNGSGVMNFRRVAFETIGSPASQGDYNGDGQVDAADYTTWRANNGGRLPAADGNGDGLVNRFDYAWWRSRYGDETVVGAAASESAPAPEPAAVALVGGLLAAFSGRRRATST